MKLIYIAGKYRAKDNEQKIINILAAQKVAIRIWEGGDYAICPHLNTAHFDSYCPDIPSEVWLNGGLEILKRCDSVYFMRGWEDSEGAVAEYKLALELGLELIFEDTKPEL